MANTTLSVAVLGLGIMGRGMAENLIAKGFKVAVYNRNPAKAEPFKGRSKDIQRAAEAHGLMILIAGMDVVRLAPALIVSDAQIDEADRIIRLAVADLTKA